MPTPCQDILLQYERNLWQQGFFLLAGIDEAGRGPLAGPVVSACVVFEKDVFIPGVYDSKSLSHPTRKKLFTEITKSCVCFGIGIVDHATIDRINIYQAAKLSMTKAFEELSRKPDFVLIDAMPLKLSVPTQSIIKGDQQSFCIAAASILAKVTRDRIMDEYHLEYPVYGWDRNKGYPTEEHREAVKKHGFSPYHRMTFNIK